MQQHADRPAILRRGEDDALHAQTYRDLRVEVDAAAAGLVAAGVRPGEHVVLLSENRPAWLVADLAIQTAGAVTVPIYPSLPGEQVQPQVEQVAARVAIVEDARQVAKLEAVREQLPELERVLVFDPDDIPVGLLPTDVAAATP